MKLKLICNNVVNDVYQTPTYAFDYLAPYINKEWRIWECAMGQGNLLNYMRSLGYDAFGTDIEYDFLSSPPMECDCIITNPPYSKKDAFLEKCYEIGKPFALLMPLTALEGKKRQRLYRKYGIGLIIPDRRIEFLSEKGRCWFATAWFVWGIEIPSQIIFAKRCENEALCHLGDSPALR
ncbi:MAG: tRNA (adenine-N(6)-)-methyltransferase [candidate division WOR-3 bacterium]